MRMPSDNDAHAPVLAVDTGFCEMALRMGQATWGIEALSQREKSLLCLLADVCDRNFGLAFEMHVDMALANAVPIEDVREVLLHAAIEAGYPNTLQALVRFKEIASKKGYELHQADSSGGEYTLNEGTRGPFNKLDPRFTRAWEAGVGQQWSRTRLSQQERAILSVAACALTQALGSPFRYYTAMALESGCTADRVRAVIVFLSEFGFAKSWQALEALQE